MLAAKFNHTNPFVMTTFGCQYHGRAPSIAKQRHIDAFTLLVRGAGVPVEAYEQEETKYAVSETPVCPHIHGSVNGDSIIGHNDPEWSKSTLPPLSHIWLSYWESESQFNTWWKSTTVQEFWQALPSTDAGFWRESCAFYDGRTMFETNKSTSNGFGHAGSLCPLGEKTGYWGAYRDRLTASTPSNSLKTSWNGGCTRRYDDSKTRKAIFATPSVPTKPAIVPRRVTINQFPENICCVVEGQDRSGMGKREREYLFENFEVLYNEWIQTATLHSSLASDGVVQARMFHDPSSGPMRPNGFRRSDNHLPLALKHNRLVQPSQAAAKIHEAYGPGGDIVDANIVLWVDLGVLKADSISAEYIGCYEGSGFLGYWDHDAFA